jgi:hypothetical protein
MKKRRKPLMTLQATSNEVTALGVAIRMCLCYVRSKPVCSQEDVLLVELLIRFYDRIGANLPSGPQPPMS